MILSKIVLTLCTDDGLSVHKLSHLIKNKLLFFMSMLIMSILLLDIPPDLLNHFEKIHQDILSNGYSHSECKDLSVFCFTSAKSV